MDLVRHNTALGLYLRLEGVILFRFIGLRNIDWYVCIAFTLCVILTHYPHHVLRTQKFATFDEVFRNPVRDAAAPEVAEVLNEVRKMCKNVDRGHIYYLDEGAEDLFRVLHDEGDDGLLLDKFGADLSHGKCKHRTLARRWGDGFGFTVGTWSDEGD